MTPKELAKLLAVTIPAGLPVLIKGAPGVGKSDIVAQAATAAEADIIISHPVVSDPTDFKGLPAVVEGKAEFLPYGELNALVNAKKRTVAFLDDLGQAPAVVQAAAMQLILARRVNDHRVSEMVTFIAATNRREDRAGVTGILEPVKSRFATIVELKPTVEDWVSWALDHKMPVELIAFVRWRPMLMTQAGTPTADIVNRPSPRTVANVGRLLNLGIMDPEVLAGAVGEGFATELVGFLKMMNELPSIDAILMDPDKADVPRDTSAIFAVVAALTCRLTAQNASRVMRYYRRLPMEFAALGVRDGLKVCKALAANKEFISWASEHQNVLL